MLRWTVDTLRANGSATADGCLVWDGPKSPSGYGATRHAGQHWYVHRLILALGGGELPDGMEVDHLCRNRACFQVSHLDVVTHRENNRRGQSPTAFNGKKEVCEFGHEFDGIRPLRNDGVSSPSRVCIECRRRRALESWHRKSPEEKTAVYAKRGSVRPRGICGNCGRILGLTPRGRIPPHLVDNRRSVRGESPKCIGGMQNPVGRELPPLPYHQLRVSNAEDAS